MKTTKNYVFLAALLSFACQNQTSTRMNPPIAEQHPKKLDMHGHERIDAYYWLNDREDERVLQYLRDENAYTKHMLAHTESFQEKLFDEIVARIPKDDESVPYKLRGYWYYTRYEKGLEYPLYCRKKGNMDAPEEVMLNVNELAEGHAYYQVGGVSVSPDNQMIAYGVDTVSRRIYTLHFKNLTTGETLEESIAGTTGGATWANDNTTLFYSRKDETLRPHQIVRYTLGDTSSEQVVYEETDETFVTYVYKSKSQEWIMIGSSSTLTTEYRFVSADTPSEPFQFVQERIRGLEYGVTHHGDHFYILTNHEGATNFKLMKAPVEAPGLENWTEVIPHREEILLEGVEVFDKYLVVDERRNGLTKLRIMEWEGGEHDIPFEEETYTAGASVNVEFDTDLFRYMYGSLTTPTTIVEYNMAERTKKVLKVEKVLGDFDSSRYEAKRIWATAEDGVQIPISLVYRKDLYKPGQSPCLIYGYGSYGYTVDPGFGSVRLSLINRGFVFAIAHIRGGQYLGRPWYDHGKLLEKKNTFTDFVACSSHLVKEGYSAPDGLFAMGGSAGGLLMGAVVNMAPELYRGVIAAVPFVDVVTTMLDESIPLTTGEYDEWGNPNDPEYYHYMKSYSPYDNVKAQAYPNMLVTTGLHDSQVQYWEPAKWVAKLRTLKTDENLLLLETNMDAGHSGASGRFQRHKETALEYAFILDLAGIKE
jgi:oligopeptidase B